MPEGFAPPCPRPAARLNQGRMPSSQKQQRAPRRHDSAFAFIGRRGRGRRAARPLSRPRRRARGLALSRTRLKALIEAGMSTIDGVVVRDPAARVAEGAADRGSSRRRPSKRPRSLAEDIAARHRLRGRASAGRSTSRPASSSTRPPGTPRHAGQRADRPLRRQPVGHRRGQAAGHRPSARQGHLRPAGRRQDRRRPSGPRRRCSPTTAAQARWCANICALVWGALGRAVGRRSTRRSAATPAIARRWRCVAGERGRAGGHPLAGGGDARGRPA